MATISPSSLTKFDLTEPEQLAGEALSQLNCMVLQNMQVEAMEAKFNLDFDVNNPAAYAQQEAYLRGKADVLRYLLEASTVAHERLTHSPQK